MLIIITFKKTFNQITLKAYTLNYFVVYYNLNMVCFT